jgi:O-acetyl-ADP-ribose deacetylase (regulator of RNase III)
VNVEVLDTDITKLEVDAIANGANTDLKHGGGVAGVVSRAGGPAIQAESNEKAPIGPGEAIETSGDELGARSLALVAIGTGVGGFSLDEAARIEIDEVFRYREAGGSAIERVVFAARGDEARRAFERAMAG